MYLMSAPSQPALQPRRSRYRKPVLRSHGRLSDLTRVVGGPAGNTDNNPDMGANMKTEL